ncbi:MAG: hypothetical protein CK527_03405 [Nitrosarchaeum sp.]|nr:MAG: hypothetical protein CK527_03405 [Nitrosarchaeum sp.]
MVTSDDYWRNNFLLVNWSLSECFLYPLDVYTTNYIMILRVVGNAGLNLDTVQEQTLMALQVKTRNATLN